MFNEKAFGESSYTNQFLFSFLIEHLSDFHKISEKLSNDWYVPVDILNRTAYITNNWFAY